MRIERLLCYINPSGFSAEMLDLALESFLKNSYRWIRPNCIMSDFTNWLLRGGHDESEQAVLGPMVCLRL